MMRLFFMGGCFILFSSISFGQRNPTVNSEQYETIAESNSTDDINEDGYLQDLNYIKDHPINLNFATKNELSRLGILNTLQIKNFLSFRKLLGHIIDLHELQAIPGWDLYTIQQILPFVVITEIPLVKLNLKQRLIHGESSMMARYSQILEKSKGYLIDSATKRHYLGSPAKIFFRYKFQCKNLFQFGITTSKDAGEQFFKGSEKTGFDFYSFHLFAKDIGIIKAIAIGDYTLNMGQGLLQWQSMGFKKGGDVINIERQPQYVKSYTSSGQVNYHRGVAVNLEKKHLGSTLFFSVRDLDANFKLDSLGEDFVSSLQSSGYHRTSSEISHKNKLRQIAVGGNLYYDFDNFHVGVNSIGYHFSSPIFKSSKLYNKYAFSGSKLWDNSFDYSGNFKSIRYFGELALDDDFHCAISNGLMMALDKKTDVSFLYRNISRAYHSLYSNAFTENSAPVNETGFYAGLNINFSSKLKLNTYYDVFSFPWIKYRIDLPSSGNDFMFRLNYIQKNDFNLSCRYRIHRKPSNYNPDQLPISPVIAIPTASWKFDFNYTPTGSAFELSGKTAFLSYNKGEQNEEHGYLMSIEGGYYPHFIPYFINAGYEYFETDGTNSKIYSPESDVLNSATVSGLAGKGIRCYFNINYEYDKKFSLFLRYSRSYYPQKTSIGSGLDQITGNSKSEVKLEIMCKVK